MVVAVQRPLAECTAIFTTHRRQMSRFEQHSPVVETQLMTRCVQLSLLKCERLSSVCTVSLCIVISRNRAIHNEYMYCLLSVKHNK